MLLDYQISLLYLYKKIYFNHSRPPFALSLGAKKVLIISTDLFWHLGQLPIKLIIDFKMSLSRSMKHDLISVILSSLAFTLIHQIYWCFHSKNKDLWKFNAEVEMFTVLSVLFISCSAVSLGVFKFPC